MTITVRQPTKADVGLSNVDNTSDANKPISTATATALSAKADASAVTTALSGKVNTTDVIAIAKGGTGQTTANASLNALLPSQSGNNGKFLVSDGVNTSWITVSSGGGTTTNALTINNGGSGVASGGTFNGSAAITISHNSIGALALSGGTMTGAINWAASGLGVANAIVTLGGGRFFNTNAAASSNGKNIFIGQNTPNVSGRTAAASYESSSNCAFGYGTMASLTSGSSNLAFGESALGGITTGSGVSGIGANAMLGLATGNNATAVGSLAGIYKVDGSVMTAFDNVTLIGANTKVSGSNQVQLGDSATTTYVFGTVQSRSDARDKTDVRNTLLGLDFINKLRPVDYRWDYRDDYNIVDTDKDGKPVIQKLEKDGSKKRNRFHHGLIAQEVKAVIDETGIDFAGYQDHSKAGGADVMSIGYAELIAPMIRAIQELTVKVESLEAQING